jgi:hypothetical protein
MKPREVYQRILVAGGIILAAGCGLSEYQNKYEKQQDRMNYLDQENQFLGPPVALPAKKDSNDPRVSVRLPWGMKSKPDDETLGILHRYAKSAAKPPQGADVKVNEIESAFAVVAATKKWKDFKAEVLEPFKNVDAQSARTVSLEIPGRPPRTFETLAFTEGTDPAWEYRFYFFKGENSYVAIGFRGSEKALASETTRQAMEFSVKTLAVDIAPAPAEKKSSGG